MSLSSQGLHQRGGQDYKLQFGAESGDPEGLVGYLVEDHGGTVVAAGVVVVVAEVAIHLDVAVQEPHCLSDLQRWNSYVKPRMYWTITS